jgi:hypothetical protein
MIVWPYPLTSRPPNVVPAVSRFRAIPLAAAPVATETRVGDHQTDNVSRRAGAFRGKHLERARRKPGGLRHSPP